MATGFENDHMFSALLDIFDKFLQLFTDGGIAHLELDGRLTLWPNDFSKDGVVGVHHPLNDFVRY